MDVEMLIACVKEKPILYDYRNPCYKNKDEKDKNWKEIATKLGTSSAAVKSRWRNLRDCYSKHLKAKTKTGQSDGKYRYWQWSHHMDFMKQLARTTTIQEVDISVNQEQEEEIHQDSLIVKDEPVEKEEPQDEPMAYVGQMFPFRADDGNKQVSVRKPLISRLYKRKAESNPDHFPISFKAQKTQNALHCLHNKTNNGLDATEHIFLGYAKIINTFSPRRQVEAKIKIASVMMELELQHLQETSGRNSTASYTTSPRLSPRYSN